jgi:thiol:disulfide interchange protein DsbC
MKITGISDSSVKGLWLVSFVNGSNTSGSFLVDYGKKNIIAGVVIPVGDALTVAKAPLTAKVDMPRMPFADGSIIIGDIKSPKKILVFTNPDCSFCAKQHEIIKKVAATRKDVVFFLKLKPFSAHWDAKRKSISILCNDSQSASLSMLVDAYSAKKIPDPAPWCSDKAVNNNISLAEKLGVKVVPTLIYEGKIHAGVLDEKGIENFIK